MEIHILKSREEKVANPWELDIMEEWGLRGHDYVTRTHIVLVSLILLPEMF